MKKTKIEDLHKDCNSVINEKLVCFEKKDNQYYVYIGVYGFTVTPENYKSCPFQDLLPLYVIPESKLKEHMELFKQTFYNIEVKL